MRTNIQRLPGVKKIFSLDSRKLQNEVRLKSISLSVVEIMTDLVEIPFFGDADCEHTSTKDSNGYEDSVTLKFSSFKPLHQRNHLAFVVVTPDNKTFLIGSKEKPATVKFTGRVGAPAGSPAVLEFEITHKDIKTMLPCRIYND